jgi:hypothetical protein
MYAHQVPILHFPMVVAAARSGLRGLGASVPLSLTIDSPYQVVGGKPKFTLIGAPPLSPIWWTSFKDGKATGEHNAGYGQFVESNGTAELEGGAWTENDIGLWDKIILVKGPADQTYQAKVTFRVSAAAPAEGPAPAAGGGILDTLLNEGFQVGSTFIPYAWAIGGGAALWFFFKKR